RKLAAALPELSYDELLAKLKGNKRFVWIKRNLSPKQYDAVHRLGVPGVEFQREDRRIYPVGAATAHVVGFTGVDNNGLSGLEQSMDKRLRSDPTPLQLSLDIRLQHVMRKELQQTITDFSAIGGAGMIYDVRTGEVLAMVSLPDFDPQNPTGLDPETLFNRNTLGVYEMGSTFKIFNSAMALDSGAVRLNESFDATQSIHIGRFTINDFHGKHRWLTVPEIFQYSSNIGSVRMALQAGTATQKNYLGKFGLLNPAPVEVPEVGAPMVPNPWREINTMTVSFGHGISVSPMQVVAGASAAINGGLMRPATLVKREADAVPTGERVITPQTSAQMRKLFRLVVSQGSASAANVPGYLVGGKTGTAEKSAGRHYNKNARLSSFVGAFPMNDPRYMVYVMVDEPKGTAKTQGYATGGWVAAPAAGRIIKQIGPLLGVPTIDDSNPEIRRALDIEPSHQQRSAAVAALPAGHGR
ncbi:MAG TPA: penicillin-binding protein 2, partial [Azospirillaceae bacterium]|nr:penicillin-binding protein 2 [Azospirillaceae bacterium]